MTQDDNQSDLQEQSSSGRRFDMESIQANLRDLVKKRSFWMGVLLFAGLLFLAANDALGGTVFLIIAFLLYFLPAVIARKKPNASSVFVINLFLGWTLIGWVVALAMAVADPKPSVIVQTPSPSPTSQPQNRSVSDRLAELERLRESGVVSQEEYEAKRQDLVDSL